VRRGARFLLTAGTAGCVLGLSALHGAANHYDYVASSRLTWSLVFLAVLSLGAYGFGLPDGVRTRRGAALSAVGTTALAAVSVSVAQLLAGDALLPRAVVLGSAVVLVPWYVLCAAIARDAFARDEERDRVVLVASDDEAGALRRELERVPERPALLVATLTPGEARPHDPPARPLVSAAIDTNANVIVLDRDAQADEEIVVQAALLHERGIRVRTLTLFYEQWLGKLPVNELERVSLLFDIGEVHAPRYARVKRIFDVTLALVGCMVLALVTPLVVVGNALGNPGSLFFRQRRVGRGGQVFEMLKLRTMIPVTDVEGSDPTLEHDPRITRFGGFLRRAHIDELPQVLNILRGELSVVGPRPEQPHLVERLAQKIPFYKTRHLVRPGLTGWAQVKYHYGADEQDAIEKLQYEVYYLRRQGLALDVRIVARTLRSVLAREGR
jgi:lipopolysaccharide/colanic/teichoic acid biosynthesis glycosyltransferase